MGKGPLRDAAAKPLHFTFSLFVLHSCILGAFVVKGGGALSVYKELELGFKLVILFSRLPYPRVARVNHRERRPRVGGSRLKKRETGGRAGMFFCSEKGKEQ